MHRTVVRLTLCSLALLVPLTVTSCSSPTTQHLSQGTDAQTCPGCISFTVKTWFFTPSPGENVSDIIPANLSPAPFRSGLSRTILPLHDRDLPRLFSQKGWIQQGLEMSSVTTWGQSLPVIYGNTNGEFNAVITPVRPSEKGAGALVSFDMSAALSGPENFESTNRVLLRNGEAFVTIQKTMDAYLIWLIRADFPG